MMKVKTNNFEIEIIEQILIPLYYVYYIKIHSIGQNEVKISQIVCNGGFNLVRKNRKSIMGLDLLQDTILKNNSVKGYIAFEKSNLASNQPKIFFDSNSIHLRKIPCRRFSDV